MSWFRKKKKAEADNTIYAPASGTFVRQEDLSDPMFAQGMMGSAFGIHSTDGSVVSPFDGEVTMTFPTGHALGLKRPDGLEVLIHIGVDTVNLNGEGFQAKVSSGQTVSRGQELVRFDPALIRSRDLDPTVICAFTSPVEEKQEADHGGQIQAGDSLYTIVAGAASDD